MRGLDYLESLPFVDGAAMAAIGHSLGGHNSVYTAVFDERLKVVVSNCGLDSFLDYYGGDEKNWQPERGWCQTRYMPKLADIQGPTRRDPIRLPRANRSSRAAARTHHRSEEGLQLSRRQR